MRDSWREAEADDRALTTGDRVVRGLLWLFPAAGIAAITLLGVGSAWPKVAVAVAVIAGALLWIMVYAAVVVRQRGRARHRRTRP